MPFVEAPLDVRKVGDATWQLLAPVTYRGRWGTYTVPAGYVTDFASVPRFLWWFTPQSGRWDSAAVVHDWLITDRLAVPDTLGPTSSEVDAEFRGALKALRVGFVQRWLMWAGVRWAAVLNPVRRGGWLRTLPLLLTVTGAALAPIAGAVYLALSLVL
jgi:hypothetical protein